MCEHCEYKDLGPWPGSNYRQYLYTGRKIRAQTLYRATVGLDPRTPEQVAEDYDVPVEAVLQKDARGTRRPIDLLAQRPGGLPWGRAEMPGVRLRG